MKKPKRERLRVEVFSDDHTPEERAQALSGMLERFRADPRGTADETPKDESGRDLQKRRTRELAGEITTEINELRRLKAQDGKDERAIEVVAEERGKTVKRLEQLYMGPDPDDKPRNKRHKKPQSRRHKKL